MDLKYYLKFWTKSPKIKKQIVTKKFNNVFDITYSTLREEGIECIVFDIDDTLTDHLGKIEDDMYKLLDRIIEKGFKIGIYSNCSEERFEELQVFFKEYDFFNVRESKKPNPDKYLEILKHYNLEPSQAAMVGDKIGSDLFGAFLAGFKERILVKPYSSIMGGNKGPSFPQLMRMLEKKLT